MRRCAVPCQDVRNGNSLQRTDSKLSAIREVVHILNNEYGKHLPEHLSLPKSILVNLRRNGLHHYANRLVQQVRGRFHRGS